MLHDDFENEKSIAYQYSQRSEKKIPENNLIQTKNSQEFFNIKPKIGKFTSENEIFYNKKV